MLSITISINKDSIGNPLPLVISNDIITNIIITINGKNINFLDIIKNGAKFLTNNHKDNIIQFDKYFKFYLLIDKFNYLLAVKVLDKLDLYNKDF